MNEFSVAMTAAIAEQMKAHLLRADGQEDVCLALYAPSTGATRTTALIQEVVPPLDGERKVHGNATVTGDYVLRVACLAAQRGLGMALAHSHPHGRNWQRLSRWDSDCEGSYRLLTEKLTGFPLVGLTLAGDRAWSGRTWSQPVPTHATNVRVVGDRLTVTWNDTLRPPPILGKRTVRTTSAWGPDRQASIARLSVLVIGVGSVGLDIALRLAAAGIERVGVMDFDVVKEHNLDRLIPATDEDAQHELPKTALAARELARATTAEAADVRVHNSSITTLPGLLTALDYDIVFSCVDRPWPRAVLNALAYTDLIPVIDGGIDITAFESGDGMRNYTTRAHSLMPGQPCMVCTKQLSLTDVQLDRSGDLDDPAYIKGAGRHGRGRENVAMLSVGVTAALLAQFASLTSGVGHRGVPGPLRFNGALHDLEHMTASPAPHCHFENNLAAGDGRMHMTNRAFAPDRGHGCG